MSGHKYAGVVAMFIFMALLFLVVRAWVAFGAVFVKQPQYVAEDVYNSLDGTTTEVENNPAHEDDTELQKKSQIRISRALMITAVITIVAIGYLAFTEQTVREIDVHRPHDVFDYIATHEGNIWKYA